MLKNRNPYKFRELINISVRDRGEGVGNKSEKGLSFEVRGTRFELRYEVRRL